MAVNLSPPRPEDLLPVKGVKLGVAEAGIRRAGRKDLLLMTLGEGASVAGVFTQNRFCAAPVHVAKEHLSSGSPRALLVNTGNANAGTGEAGIGGERASCAAAAKLVGCESLRVLPFSTGVIMELLPVERIVAGLPTCVADLREDNWARAAEAIMTTDTVPNARSQRAQLGGGAVTVTGIAKGSGMIRPDMATLLAFVATDAPVALGALRQLLADAAARSFNRISVDGDTSTNDSFVLIATGASGGTMIAHPSHPGFAPLREGGVEVAPGVPPARWGAGGGGAKLITSRVVESRIGTRTTEQARRVLPGAGGTAAPAGIAPRGLAGERSFSLAQDLAPRFHPAGCESAPHPPVRPAWSRQPEGADRAEHAPVRRRPNGQQRAPDRGARHGKVLARQGRAREIPPPGPAPHRSGKARSHRSPRYRRSGGRAVRAVYPVLRRLVVRALGGRGLQGAQGRARRFDRSDFRESPHLRDVESASSYARVHAGKSRDQAPRR